MTSRDEQRVRLLRFTLLCLLMPPTEPELRMLHRCFDTRGGLAQIATGLARQGLRASVTHVGPGEWRCFVMGDNPMLAPRGFGVAPTRAQAVHQAAYAAVGGVG